MKKVLITGGPVYAKLDAVKIITNKFKGGMMSNLADRLAETREVEVTYLCTKGSVLPENRAEADNVNQWIPIVYHDGFEDYRAKVLAMAKDFDCVILGAAVSNLIPTGYYKGSPLQLADKIPVVMPLIDKFPSHNYKPGDRIVMEWTIAPRVIDEVKAKMKPGAHLIGFKLLNGVSYTELATAAYGVLRESGATVVFANDAKNLRQKYAITKEFGEIPMGFDTMTPFILRLLEDEYYHTAEMAWTSIDAKELQATMDKVTGLIKKHKDDYVEYEGILFGSFAWRMDKGFVTTARGKRSTDELSVVLDVDHDKKCITVLRNCGTPTSKASLNAPLLATIFQHRPDVFGILHFHRQEKGLETQNWAPPGTVRDSIRGVRHPFNVEGHGCYLFLNEKGELI